MRFDSIDLANEWDHMESNRSRLREGGTYSQKGLAMTLLSNKLCRTRMLSMQSWVVLLAVGLELPDIESLREQVSNIYVKCNRQVGKEDVDDDAWDIRGMLRMIKRKARRGEVSMDTVLNLKLVGHFWYLLSGPSRFSTKSFSEEFMSYQLFWIPPAQDVDFQDMILIDRPELEAPKLELHQIFDSLRNASYILKVLGHQL